MFVEGKVARRHQSYYKVTLSQLNLKFEFFTCKKLNNMITLRAC